MTENYKIDKYNEHFDFFDDEIPETDKLYFALGDQLKRARAILKKRSREEVNYIIESLEWMLRESSRVEFENSMQLLESEDAVFINRVKAFKLFSNDYDISDQESLPNASWADYFATLSLITVLEALHPESHEYVISNPDYSLEALEAVCIAEFHKDLEHSESLTAKRKGKAGGKKRAQKYESLKNIILSEYAENEKYNNKSNRQSAKILTEKFSDQIQPVLSSENARETIEKWISKYKKYASSS